MAPGSQKNLTRAHQASAQPDDPDDELIIRVPACLRRTSGEVRLVLPPQYAKDLRSRPNAMLIKAMARAQEWNVRLMSNCGWSFRSIAASEGCTQRYVMRVLRLTFLAPDIVEAIVEGRQPIDLDLDRLFKIIPIAWVEQRRVLRF